MEKYEVIIIGGGPAGISTSVQLHRLGIKYLLIEQNKELGGLLRNAYRVENFVGANFGIKGEDLTNNMISHLKMLNGNFKLNEKIVKINKNNNDFIVIGKQFYLANIVIYAGGTKPKTPDIYDSSSDLPVFFDVLSAKKYFENKNKLKLNKIYIIGGGEAAADYALSMSEYGFVTLLVRNTSLKANERLKKQVFTNKKININFSSSMLTYNENNNKIVIEYKINNKEKSSLCDVLIFAIGRQTTIQDIVFNFDYQKENNFFIIGDALNGKLGQAAIAVGNGLKVASTIYERLKG